MSDEIKQGVHGRMRHSAPGFAVPVREQQHASELAAFAGSTDSRKPGYGALAFWTVIAILVAARIAFPTRKDQPTSSLLGTKATAVWIADQGSSTKN